MPSIVVVDVAGVLSLLLFLLSSRYRRMVHRSLLLYAFRGCWVDVVSWSDREFQSVQRPPREPGIVPVLKVLLHPALRLVPVIPAVPGRGRRRCVSVGVARGRGTGRGAAYTRGHPAVAVVALAVVVAVVAAIPVVLAAVEGVVVPVD